MKLVASRTGELYGEAHIPGDKSCSHRALILGALASGTGWYWMACGALITAVQLLVVGVYARWVMRMNYMTLCGLLAGSMTDPPALAFAGDVTQSDAPSIAYVIALRFSGRSMVIVPTLPSVS